MLVNSIIKFHRERINQCLPTVGGCGNYARFVVEVLTGLIDDDSYNREYDTLATCEGMYKRLYTELSE